jgi:hypothetical protein
VPSALPRRLGAALVAVAVFLVSCGLALVVMPYAVGALYRCVPPDQSCGDSVGWAMLISAPVSIPLVLIVSSVLAVLVYGRLVRRPGQT